MYVLGIDGGGTKTVAWLAPRESVANTVVLGRGQAGPGNPRAAGFETAQTNIVLAIDAAFRDAGLARQRVAAACMGLAGAGREVEQRQIEAWAKQQGIAERVRVCGDAEPVLAAASAGNTGIALICGTGSLAWGRNAAGEIGRCGGWGYLISDEGSGYSIAMAGLRAAVRHADGRGPQTKLLASMLEALGVLSPQEIVEGVYSRTREQLADLCKVVFERAAEDAVAASIVETAAAELAELVVVLRQKLTLSDDDFHLALTGSVILKQAPLQVALQRRLEADACRPRSITPVSEPVRGAVALARAL